MDPSERSTPRGRARGRSVSRSPPQEAPTGTGAGEGQQGQVYEHMYEDGRRRTSDGSGNGHGSASGESGNGNGSNGNGSARGAIGNGRGEGVAGGLSDRAAEEEARRLRRDRALTADYVVSRPNAFVKQGTIQNRDQSLVGPTIVTNYYGFGNHPQFRMRLYNVKVEPVIEPDETWKVRRLIAANRERLGSYITTGFMFFATRPIPEANLIFNAVLEREPDNNYTVTLEYARDVDQSEPIMFQFYNVVVRQMQEELEFKLLGRHFFDPEGRVRFPNWRLELWPGFQNSIRQQDGGLMLNVESVWKVLRQTNILEMMGNVRQEHNHRGPQAVQQACNTAFEGMIVVTMYNKKAYKISRIDYRTNPASTFEWRGVARTYMDYYQEKYRINIQSPNQPMLVSEPRERERRRGQGDIYLVPELCYPCGLNEELRSNFRLMKDLASCLHMPAQERVDTMQTFINRVNQNQPIVETMRRWGIRINDRPVEFKARFLNSEEIIMGGSSKVSPDDKADWTNAFRTQRMLTSMRLGKWAVIVTNRDSQGVGNLVGTMQRVGNPLGYNIAQPEIVRADHVRQFPQKVDEVVAKSRGALDMIMIILPNNQLENYAAVKKRCTAQFGIPSQCFLAKHFNNSKGLMSICTKMVVQMNAKQGGEPWGVINPLKNVMVVGYDVHHGGQGGGGGSVGAMCATTNQNLGQYFSCVRKMPADREEVATLVASMFQKCLEAYKEKNAVLPSRVFMYRDGVGEGQLKAVYEQEIQAFKDVIKAAYGEGASAACKLSYIVVNKRINTRFFHRSYQGLQNPRPGLIVDDVVTRPERYDFFLVSQTARQGCVSPTYYNVLFDQSDLPADRMQMYTFKLCHLYYNWSGTVAVPSPCQNAHKLAFQVGTAIKAPPNDRLKYLLHFL